MEPGARWKCEPCPPDVDPGTDLEDVDRDLLASLVGLIVADAGLVQVALRLRLRLGEVALRRLVHLVGPDVAERHLDG
jgi:hypothetical protein